MAKRNYKIGTFAIMLLVSIVFLFLTLSIASIQTNTYYSYHRLFQILLLILGVLGGIITSLFFADAFFPYIEKPFIEILEGKNKIIKVAYLVLITLLLSFSFFIIYKLTFSTVISVIVNDNANLIIVKSDKEELFSGRIPENNLTEIRIDNPNDSVEFIFKNGTQIIINRIAAESLNGEIISVKFDDITKVRLDQYPEKLQNSLLLTDSLLVAQNTIAKNLFVEIIKSTIAERFSIYNERPYSQNVYELNKKDRTFFTPGQVNDEIFSIKSDYGDFLKIIDKIARKQEITTREYEFLQKAKPVFDITLFNKTSHEIRLDKITLNIHSVDPINGGGAKILQSEIMYEIEVPDKKGYYSFAINGNNLLISPNSYSEFSLGLNSTHKDLLPNGVTMYIQRDYTLDIILDFGRDGKVMLPIKRIEF